MQSETSSHSKSVNSEMRKGRKHKSKPYDSTGRQDASGLPGVQKLKSAIRQTRRLLAKDNLAADVRVETERRLKSLEADLQVAEEKRKERAFAVKYHKVKFFERKKVLRRIKQAKNESDAEDSSKKPSTALDNALFELRVDLNYILHYPKLEKYISLFPSSDGSEEFQDDETSSRRKALRDRIREEMEEGRLSMRPELDIEEGQMPKTKDKTHLPSASVQTHRTKPTMKKSDGATHVNVFDPPSAIEDGFFIAGSDTNSGGSDAEDG